MIRSPALSGLKGLRHGFLTRKGGVSAGPFASLNCGYGSEDLESNVDTNRKRAAQELGLSAENLVTVYQVHSNIVVDVTRPWGHNDRPHADGMVSCVPDLALGVLTADCVPILLADIDAGVIGAAHAGWKGALGGIAEATLSAMEKLGARRKNTFAAIGPCIRQASYEVGAELRNIFVSRSYENSRHFTPSVNTGHFMFDLAAFVLDSLKTAGVGVVDDTKHDTYKDESLFFSYRRAAHQEEANYGRGISLIALEEI